MNFKREHSYKLKPFEEQLYKEVMYDARPSHMINEQVTHLNQLKRVRSKSLVRNLTAFHEEAKEQILYPRHKPIPLRVTNVHDEKSNLVDPFAYL